MTFFTQLEASTQQARAALYAVPLIKNALAGRLDASTYRAYLAQAYHHVKHTPRFLMLTGASLPESHQWLLEPLAHYIAEERGHHEWILNDIAAMGGDKEAVRASTPLLDTQVLVAYNYDFITRRNPVGFFGMVYMLESVSVHIATPVAQALEKALKVDERVSSYLRSHGALDVSHMAFFTQLMGQITDPQDQKDIIEVAQNTFHLFANLLQAVDNNQEKNHVAAG